MSKRKQVVKPPSQHRRTLLEQLKRKRNEKDLKQRFLIVCEDNKSAPNYFRVLKKHFNLSATSIEAVGSDGHSQPIQVVEKAIHLKENALKVSSGTTPFDQVWCVIDGDYGNKIPNARAKAKAKKVFLAVSTMCFEYWILLHVEEYDAASLSCEALIKVLKRKAEFKKYEKGSFDFSKIIDKVHEGVVSLRHRFTRQVDRVLGRSTRKVEWTGDLLLSSRRRLLPRCR
jgi:hypothetical protein